MKKTTFILLLICSMTIMTGCNQNRNNADGVVINGVKWATRNVGMPGTFAETPECFGMLYVWNSKEAWNAIDKRVEGWRGVRRVEDSVWTRANDPSPTGWRVPTYEEVWSLTDRERVRFEWTTQNGVEGVRFTDRQSRNSIFLPLVNIREFSLGNLRNEDDVTRIRVFYWTSTENSRFLSHSAVYLTIWRQNNNASLLAININYALPIRSVAE